MSARPTNPYLKPPTPPLREQDPPAVVERPQMSRKEWEAQRMEEVKRWGKSAHSDWRAPKPSGPPR
jgi:hypothetical protein